MFFQILNKFIWIISYDYININQFFIIIIYNSSFRL